MSDYNNSRRKFIKAAAYTAPVILTLQAAPTFAKSGSHMHDRKCGHQNSNYGSKLKARFGSRMGSKLKPRRGSKMGSKLRPKFGSKLARRRR